MPRTSTTKTANLEDKFLEALQKDGTSVSIFLVNGIKLHGIISEFTEGVIMLTNGVTQMVYKHAVSTIVPARNIKFSTTPSGNK